MATLNLNKKKFIDEENLKTIVKIGINFGEKLNALEAETITDYDETKTYLKGESCYYDNYVYRCKSTATGAWNPDRWDLVGDDITELTLDEIKAMLGLTTEQLTTLSSIILDSEVRLDKTYSSSKIYTSIQDAIDTSKAYTLAEIGKASGASYKIASSTSDMTDEKIIYLLNNGTNFDMYIVDNGTPTKIGDTNIDLSGYLKIDEANNIYLKKTDATSTYATKTEINNDFLKKTDATSTYATKVELNDKADATALDDKVDKTDIVNNLTSTDTNKPLSANQGKALDDKKIDKTSITTTIDGTNTDTQVPTAKSVYNLAGNENRRGFVYNNPTYRGDTWNRVFRVNSLLSCDSGFLTVTVYSSGLCQIATFLMSKNFSRLNVKQINCGGYNGNNGQTRPIKVRIISAETSGYSFLEIYVSGTSDTNVVATYMPLSCNSVVVLNEKGSIPSGMFACEMTATHDTYTSATYTSILK